MDEVCNTCGEKFHFIDPGMSPLGFDSSKFVCFYCGYLNVPPGAEREKIRADRILAQAPRPDVGPVDVVKSKCQQSCCTDPDFKPVPIVTQCPNCGLQHIDVGEWATKRHRRHRCVGPPCEGYASGGCGFEWQPAHVFTVGVERK